MRVILVATLFAASGCAAAQQNEMSSDETQAKVASSPGLERDTDETAENQDRESLVTAIHGTWENGSCGERKYNRKISFEEGGKWKAVDEIAPCPEGEECDLTGIIEWRGTWSLEGKVISFEPVREQNQRMPETIPDSFVVLIENPISIGEKKGTLVCPYQSVQ